MNIYGTHWLSMAFSFVTFGIVMMVRGPDALVLLECTAIIVATIVGVGVSEKMESVAVYESDDAEWKRRCMKLEDAIIEHEQLTDH